MKNLNLIGCAEGWQDAPYSDECWGITSLVLKRNVDRSFDMHDFTWTKKQWFNHYLIWMGDRYGRNYLNSRAEKRIEKIPVFFDKINELGIPFYSIRSYPQVPTSVSYPLKKISAAFETFSFASTADFAISMAIHEGFEVINLYGFNMNVKSEYEHQIPSFGFWLGLAKGLGIQFKIHGESAILKSKTGLIYGYNVKPMEVGDGL